MNGIFLRCTTMNQLYKGKAKYISVWVCTLLILAITLYSNASVSHHPFFHSSLTADTVPVNPVPPAAAGKPKTDSGLVRRQPVTTTVKVARDTVPVKKVDTLTYRASKDSLTSPVFYHADDSMILDVPGKKILLYGKQSMVKFDDNELVAPFIEFDQKTSIVSATLVRDSNGNVIAFPAFTQGNLKTVSDEMRFNMKTRKGLTKGTYTQQDELFIYAERIKKTDPDIFYALRGRFTTCNLDTPHFAFVSKRIKFVNQKMAYTGPVHPEVEGVPIPIYLPFGIYPMKRGRHSGLLAPTFTANEQLGLALEGLGYYKVINDRWDVILRGTLYSYGGWTASVSPRYFKRYRYQGNLAFDIQHFRDLDNQGSRSFNLRWSHTADTKARPGVTFNANVNAGSSRFNSQVPNSPARNFQNQMSSSITWAKVWKDKPYNVTISANHNQNTNSKLVNINLPDIAFNVNTLYPFRRKEVVGEYKWYENLGIALNSNVRGLTSFYDTTGNFFNQLADKFQWGANHNVPLTLSLPQLGNFQLGPTVTYQERWFQKKTRYSWNAADKKLDTVVNKGFYAAREMQFGLGISTRIFGLFTFNKRNKVQAIRHELRPTVSVSYKPDMNRKSWYSSQSDTFNTVSRYSYYDGSVYGGFGEGKFGGISFGLENNLQMKVRSRKDTGEASIRKITLLDGLSINGSYNFLADSFQLSVFNVAARTNLFDKVNITAGAILDPYIVNSRGERIDKLVWASKRPISLGRMVSANVAVQTQFQGGDKKEKLPQNATNSQLLNQVNPVSGLPLDEYEQEAAYIRNNPGEFANFNIPWSISLSYSLSLTKQRKYDYTGMETFISQNVNWNGTLNLTPKWQLGMNAYYNITTKELGSLSMYLSREMHCWQMAINISPVGKYRFFNISISPKSGLLRDLKVNRTRYFYDL